VLSGATYSDVCSGVPCNDVASNLLFYGHCAMRLGCAPVMQNGGGQAVVVGDWVILRGTWIPFPKNVHWPWVHKF